MVMFCSKSRPKYPFDIQHRLVISYKGDSVGDYTDLSSRITEKLRALIEKGAALDEISQSGQVSDIEGLSPTELMFVACLAANTTQPDSAPSVWSVRQDAEKAGLTAVACTLAIHRLTRKGMIEVTTRVDEERTGDSYSALVLTPKGWDWIDANESKFTLRKPRPGSREAFDSDDIPF